MTAPTNDNQPVVSDKELNFRALEAKYERKLNEQRTVLEELQKKLEQVQPKAEEEDDDEPYVDKRRMGKALNNFEEKITQKTQSAINQAVTQAVKEERKNAWLKNNPDFYDVLQHAGKLAEQDPELAETILAMPDTFERQQLVYKNIKALNVHKPQKVSSIQDKIDANRRSPYYQPSGQGAAPYSSVGDFSPSGQKQAYDKLQELKRNLRL